MEVNTLCEEKNRDCISIYMENVFDCFQETRCGNSIYLYGKQILFLKPAYGIDFLIYLYGIKQMELLILA